MYNRPTASLMPWPAMDAPPWQTSPVTASTLGFLSLPRLLLVFSLIITLDAQQWRWMFSGSPVKNSCCLWVCLQQRWWSLQGRHWDESRNGQQRALGVYDVYEEQWGWRVQAHGGCLQGKYHWRKYVIKDFTCLMIDIWHHESVSVCSQYFRHGDVLMTFLSFWFASFSSYDFSFFPFFFFFNSLRELIEEASLTNEENLQVVNLKDTTSRRNIPRDDNIVADLFWSNIWFWSSFYST